MKKIINILKVLILSYVITALLLLLGAFIMYKAGLGESMVRVITLIIYGVSTISGGLLYAKIMKSRKLLRGALIGLIYYIMLFIVSCIIRRGLPEEIARIPISVGICIIGGALGGLMG